ncbi:MAG: NAD(+) synthase, partial [Oscillospiraceae bacterium]|nr:NAD(+) synthase [Oscillospiraceae bacterium]
MNNLIKIKAISPELKVGDIAFNKDKIIEHIISCIEDEGSGIIVFPELCITGYTCGDLFGNIQFIKSAMEIVNDITVKIKEIANDKKTDFIVVLGCPIIIKKKLYNCGITIISDGSIFITPKINLPTYGEFYEARWFSSGENLADKSIIQTKEKPWIITKNPINITTEDNRVFSLGVEICEDLWVAATPSSQLALQGADIIINLSASNEVIGKAEYRKTLVKAKSGSCNCAYVYCSAGCCESSTDLVFGGHLIISELGSIIGESRDITKIENSVKANIDLEKILHDKIKQTTYQTFEDNETKSLKLTNWKNNTEPLVNPHPFVPKNTAERANRVKEILSIQATGLATRLRFTNSKTVVLGLSGGLDSTLALLVCVTAFNILNKDKKDIICLSMPCFGTTTRTKTNAQKLAEHFGVTFREVDISASVNQHLKDMEHGGEFDIAYENARARERTQLLMDTANQYRGIVIGTGDLSELAIGWCTYNGDHMSMYAVNVSIPKTLVRYLVSGFAEVGTDTFNILKDIIETPVSPELLPADNDEIVQNTEDINGPYELHDFFLYYFVR